MTTTLKVRHLLTVDKLDAVVDGITLLVGPNESGKSTVANAAAACLSGNPLIRGIGARTRLGPVVATGQEKAQALLEGPGGARQISWPDGKVKTKGDPPTASAIATGQTKLTAMATAERAETLVGLLQATPTLEDLEKLFTKENLSVEAAKKVWDLIATDGWDGAQRNLKERTTKLKGQWEGTTGERWGIKKAEQWHPSDWDISLGDTPPDELEVIAQKARNKLDVMIGTHAVSRDETEKMQDLAGQLEHFKNNLGEFESEHTVAFEDMRQAQEERAALPSASTDRGIPCPYPECDGRRLRIGIGIGAKRSLVCVEDEKIDEDERKKRLMDIASADGKVANLESALQKLSHQISAAMTTQKLAEVARDGLKDLGGPEIAEALEAAKAAHTTAEQNHRMAEAKQKADITLSQIKNMQTALNALAPTGLRQATLGKALGGFTKKHLKPLCKMASETEIEIAADTLEISVNGHPYELLSRGAQFAADCILQIAIARMDGSAMVIIDDADILVGERRKGLMEMLSKVAQPALVCMAVKTGGQVPDLAKMGLGRTIWMDGAVAST